MVLDLLYLPILNEDVIGWVDSITFQVTSMMSPMPSNMHFIKLKKLKNAEDDKPWMNNILVITNVSTFKTYI